MKLTKEILVKLINEEISKISEQEEDGQEEDGEEFGKGGMSGAEYKKAQRQDIKMASKESKGLTKKERAIIRDVVELMKKYAQEENLAAGGVLKYLERAVKPLKKALEKK